MRRFIVRSRFTLIEMMMVLVIVMAMSAFSVGLYNYTRNIMAETKTKALIVRLDTAFRELYEKYGEYPRSTQDGTLLFSTIFDSNGNVNYDLDTFMNNLRSDSDSCLNGLSADYVKDFVNKLDLVNLILENGVPLPSDTDYCCLLDGWSRPIYYYYRQGVGGKWNTQSFDLCSSGADGNAFNLDHNSSAYSNYDESDWQEEWAKETNQLTNIWDMENYTLSPDARSENADNGDLRFSSVYGDDITNF